jgi:hypothetical protein
MMTNFPPFARPCLFLHRKGIFPAGRIRNEVPKHKQRSAFRIALMAESNSSCGKAVSQSIVRSTNAVPQPGVSQNRPGSVDESAQKHKYTELNVKQIKIIC